MATIDDRWWRKKTDPRTGKPIIGGNGKPVQEKTERHGKGMRYRVRYLDNNKKEQSESFPDKQLKRAQAFALKVESDLLAGSYRDPHAGRITIKSWGHTYIQGRSKDESSQITLNSLFNCQIYPFWGDKQLDNVGNSLRDWLTWLDEVSGISVNYQADAWDTFSAMLDAAVAEKKIDSNPCNNKAISPPRRIRRRITPWTDEKATKIGHALPRRYKPFVRLGAGIGLRLGEALAFSPDNIDRNRMVYNCTRQLVYRRGVLYFKLPKGHKTRTIPLGDGILESLDQYVDEFPPTAVTLPWAERDKKESETVNLLLTTGRNDAWRASMFGDEVWRPAFAAAGLNYAKQEDGTHALRHLFASHMLAQGVSIKELAEYLGHASEAFTLRTYVHLMPSSHVRARQAINNLFRPCIEPAGSEDQVVNATSLHGPRTAPQVT
ncbi:traSA:integrase fusion protein [Kutzneria sp. 744]|nr:traSA:integrase fusion protein [Kutzneria sp. 744]